jgi:pilus assembly protein Flp/PilA
MIFIAKEKGQGLVEYAIILSFVFLVVIVVVKGMGPLLGDTYSTINNSIP